MTAPLHKACTRCRCYLAIDQFSRDSSKASGRKSWCRECDATRARVRMGPRPSWLDLEAEANSLPAQTCRCIGGSILADDEGDIRCVRCGKSPKVSRNLRNGTTLRSAPAGVKSLRNDIKAPAARSTHSGAWTQKGETSVPTQSLSNPDGALLAPGEGR